MENRLTTEKGNLSFTLKEISTWTGEKSPVTIPALQRGLVWKPSQVELLWDSILRGFPIGSFMLSDTPDGSFYLMDGQQRFNAISLGFGSIADPRAIIWMDLRPEKIKNSSRAFWIKATTAAHPWGFANNDECGTLSASDRRRALADYGLGGRNIYNNQINLKGTWPFKAKRPIPLNFLLDAPVDDAESFTTFVMERCRIDNDYRCLQVNPISEADKKSIESLYPAFKRLASYNISCNLLSRDIMESESAISGIEGDTTALETLFTRLNTGGTRISQDDLNYSAIKAYWPDIKETNDRIAERYMPPAKLVMLAFRLALTDREKDRNFKNTLSVKQIRALAKDDWARRKICLLYENIGAIMSTIDSWLDVYDSNENPDSGATPAVLRTSIARNSPEIFLLLMHLASMKIEGRCQLPGDIIKALAFYLHWFSIDQGAAITEIYARCRCDVSLEAIGKAMSRSFGMGWLVAPYSPDEMRRFLNIKSDRKWRIWSEDYLPWHEFINRVSWFSHSETKEMLLYAQRGFLNEHFQLYDPARQDMWDSHNRPWDYDHITPQDWMKYRGKGAHKDYCEHWLWNIGNMAAIPFETNRAKSNRQDYDFYLENKDALLFNEDSAGFRPDITWKEEESFRFANITFDRCCRIYESCYAMLSPLLDGIELSDSLKERAGRMKNLKDNIVGAEFYFTSESKDYLLERKEDFTRDWVSVGVTCGKYLACVCWGYSSKALEIGLRKLPGTEIDENREDMPQIDSSYHVYGYGENAWWYAEKDLPVDTPVEEIVTELGTLVSYFKK